MRQIWILAGILGLFNFFVAVSFAPRLEGIGLSARTVWIAAVLFYLLQLIVPLCDWPVAPWRGGVPAGAVRAAYLALGVLSCLLVYALAADALTAAVRFFGGPGLPRWWDVCVCGFVAALLGATLVVGTLRLEPPVIERVDVPLPHLPAALDGLKIAQISDLHAGLFTRRDAVARVVEITNATDPDIVAVTGDLADGTVAERADALAPLRALKPALGAYFVTGNHEYYWGARAWEKEAAQLGLQVLVNRAVIVTRGGAHLAIVGVPDLTSLRMAGPVTDLGTALQETGKADLRVLLSHQPQLFDQVRALGPNVRVDLQLSGHTHGGQYFPFTQLFRLAHAYYRGLYRVGDSFLYVSRGTGFWGPPLRTAGPPEVTLLTLRATGGQSRFGGAD